MPYKQKSFQEAYPSSKKSLCKPQSILRNIKENYPSKVIIELILFSSSNISEFKIKFLYSDTLNDDNRAGGAKYVL